jgi:hypothetical protein
MLQAGLGFDHVFGVFGDVRDGFGANIEDAATAPAR